MEPPQRVSNMLVKPSPAPDAFRRREIEQKLTGILNDAQTRLRAATTEDEKQIARAEYEHALLRFTEFVTKGIVPNEFLGG